MHGPEHHVEHAEHAAHAAHDPFDRIVTMTIAIVAAVLACVTMLSHRAHNDTLRFQAEAGRFQTQANTYHTKESDAWSFYQAKNIRKYEFEAFLASMQVMVKEKGTDEISGKTMKLWTDQIAKYKIELPQLQEAARALNKKGEEAQKAADEILEKSHEAHARGDRYDLAELGVEMALVLCSIAVLTKRRSFWLSGMVIGSVGALIALATVLGLFMPGGHH
jgi:uncharacterized protein DUF4337